jgi:[acyl-carrier-protein] S-malonyltransferase
MPIAMVFPGQGSQSVGMLGELAATDKIVRDTFEEASAALGYDLWHLVQEGPAEDLNSTERTQPALLAAGVAVYRSWRARGGRKPIVMAGHSLGEYTALVCGDALDFDVAVDLVRFRGAAMQNAVPAGVGAMAAVLGLDETQIAAACEAAAGPEVVEPVNFNAPGQIVIAGHAGAVERAVTEAKSLGARRAVMLPVSVPSHCSLMAGAARELAERLGAIEVRRPGLPVIHNVDAATHDDPDDIRMALTRQLHRPVLWTRCAEALRERGATQLVEAGPGKVLVGLMKRIDRDMKSWPVYDAGSLQGALTNAT